MTLKLTTLAVLILLAASFGDKDQGTIRLNALRKRSYDTRNRIISFSHSDFEYFPYYSDSTL
jgi:hypothetical protein